MAARKPTKTLADYLVIGVSPVLVMVLVHSVCFFLVEVFYRGEGAGGVRWVLFWFVLAVVLIARIGIERGNTAAMTYGLLLAACTWLYLLHVQANPLFGALLLGLVWFTAHKVTGNCTLIDDEVDASGQGLMQPLQGLPAVMREHWKRLAGRFANRKAQPRAPGLEVRILGPRTVEEEARPLSKVSREAEAAATKRGRAEIPGIWLLYFSLAAIPVFGLGQTLLPAGDAAARRQGFIYLFCYLAAALGLLVNTSFLGLRRYLRQRYLAMPGNIAFGWVQYGAAAAALVLLLSVFLPRPGAGAAWVSLRYHVDHQLHRASEYAARFGPHGAGHGRAGNQSPPGGQPQNDSAPSGQSSAPGQPPKPGGPGESAQTPAGGSDHGAPPSSGSDGGNHGPAPPQLSPPGSSAAAWLKILFWLAASIGALWLLIRYRTAILMFCRSTWAALREFIAALLALFHRVGAAEATALPARRAVAPFHTFKNPFLSGGAEVWPPEKLIAYSYDALQSWVLEKETVERGSPETPRELCSRLAEEMPDARAAFEHLAFVYGQMAYGGSVPAAYDPGQLRVIWEYLSQPRPALTQG